jgi:hypothetical protein
MFRLLAVLGVWPPVAASAADQNKCANIHNVAVVSAIGDTLHFTVAPRILSPGAGDSLSISSWGIDP